LGASSGRAGRRRRSATGRWSSPPDYCDGAAAEDAGGPPGEIVAFVAWGMDRELREVFRLVGPKLEDIAEGQEAADE
jgi:hypothetical protein